MFQPRWYQDEAEFSIFNYYQSGGTGHPVVAMPVGSGKGVVIGNFTRRVFTYWPTQRIMMLTHVKELIEQNAKKLLEVWPTAPLGIYSAGMKRRDTIMPIVFGGVQSVVKRAEDFGHRDLVLVDECHLIGPSDDGMYKQVFNTLRQINPHVKFVGFSATPYRMRQGLITDGTSIFTDICYDLTTTEQFNRLIAEGYLAPLIPKPTNVEISAEGIGVVAGEYNQKQLEEALDDETLYKAVKETVELGWDRRCWLAFAAGVKNAEKIAAMFQSFGVAAAAVHSKKNNNDELIGAYKRGELRCLVNANKLTTGFDHPPIDLIAMFRHTLSPGLWVQMLGRGTRPSPETGKVNCLVLDFARNTPRLGPINDVRVPGRPGRSNRLEDTPPVRLCNVCGTYNHAAARYCVACGTEFTFENKLFDSAGTHELIKSDAPVVEYFPVSRAIYKKHEKPGSPPSLKVSYFCGFQMFSEWVCLEHPGLPGKRARDWWRLRHHGEPPATIDEALRLNSELRVPSRLRIWVNKQPFPEILGAEW